MFPLIFAIASVVLVWLGGLALLPASVAGMPMFWPPAGLLVGALVLSGRRRWTVWLAISLLTMTGGFVLWQGRSVVTGLELAVTSCAAAWAIAITIRRRIKTKFTLTDFTHAVAFVTTTAIVSVVAGFVEAAILRGTGASFWFLWRGAMLSDFVGLTLVAFLIFGLNEERAAWARTIRSWRAVEVVILLVAVALMTEGVFGDLLPPPYRVPAYVLPLLLWPAFRFGPGGTALTIVSVSLVGIWNTINTLGPFAQPEVDASFLRAQGSITMLSASFMLLSSIVAERKQALDEVKALRGLIPICAWCHKVRDDAGFWQRLETYLDAKTDATFSHSICPNCEETQREVVDRLPSQAWRI